MKISYYSELGKQLRRTVIHADNSWGDTTDTWYQTRGWDIVLEVKGEEVYFEIPDEQATFFLLKFS